MKRNGPTDEERKVLRQIRQQVYMLFALNGLNRGQGLFVLSDAIIETMAGMLDEIDMTKDSVIGRMKQLATAIEADGIETIEKRAELQTAKPKQEQIFNRTLN